MTEAFEAVYDANGNYVVSGEAAARLSETLGHEPEPGEHVHLALVEDQDLDAQHADDFQEWLHTVGKAAYDHAKVHPELAMSADETLEWLAEARAQRLRAE